MPSRLSTAAILAFWLAMTGWLIHREVVPLLLADLSPAYQPDLTDELGSKQIVWLAYRGGKRVGSAVSNVVSVDEHAHEFRTTFNFDSSFLQITQIDCVDRFDEDLKLLSFSVTFLVNDFNRVEVRGDVVDSALEPRTFFNGQEQKFIEWGKIDMTNQRSIMNPLRLVGRLRGLHEGQTFKIPMFDPFRGVKAPLIGELIKPLTGPPELIAKVSSGTLEWDKKETECYKIDYHEAGKEPTSRTWVRKSDGWVLQQESSHLDMDLVLKRLP